MDSALNNTFEITEKKTKRITDRCQLLAKSQTLVKSQSLAEAAPGQAMAKCQKRTERISGLYVLEAFDHNIIRRLIRIDFFIKLLIEN